MAWQHIFSNLEQLNFVNHKPSLPEPDLAIKKYHVLFIENGALCLHILVLEREQNKYSRMEAFMRWAILISTKITLACHGINVKKVVRRDVGWAFETVQNAL